MKFPDAHIEMGEYRLEFCPNAPLGPYFEEKALRELRETPQLRDQALRQLKNMVKERGELELPLEDDKIYLAFLRCCKFYTESAYSKFVKYYKFTGKNPKVFGDLTPSREEKAVKQNVYTILPNRDKEGRRILVIQGGKNWNVKEVSVTELVRAIMLLIMGAIVEAQTQVAGAVIIIDLQGLTISHAWQFSPALAKVILQYVQECVPCRVKAIHIINHPYIFNMIFSIFKPFMDEKLRNRIHLHAGGERSELKEAVGAKFLPTQYGGELNVDNVYGVQTWEMLYKFEEFYKLALENKYLPQGKSK